MASLRRIAPVLPARDVVRSLEHYRRLGFTAEAYEPAGPDGPFYGFISSGGVELHLTRTPDLDAKANTSACYIYVEDADALHGAWMASGAEGRFTRPADTPYGLREFAHVDPDGNLIRVGSPLAR
jgi:catechol 2,3-dioxygenase-like lactoylglutathione lyase family enzyme